MFNCSICTYVTDRKYNFQRHFSKKHYEIQQNNDLPKMIQNVSPNEENVSPNERNVCTKCRKVYKTKKYLENHKKKCRGVDELTCSRCMTSFTTRAAKSRHIGKNKCIARSIVHARTQNIQNITNNIQNAETIQNINNTNNIIINNLGSERIDHITENEIKLILQSGTNTIPLYIKKKHFDKNFPENNNIKYSNDNKCHVMEDNSWKEKDIVLLSTNLIQDNTEVLLMYCDNNEIQLLKDIKDTDKYEHVRNKLFIVYNKSDNQKYNTILTKIKELIKCSALENET